MGVRFTLVISGIIVIYGFLLFHLYGLQIQNGRYYLARAGSQYLASGLLESSRGIIYFTDKSDAHLPAAIDKEFPLVYAVPKAIENPAQTASEVASILGQPLEEVQKKFSKKDSYELLLEKAPPDIVEKIDGLKVKGAYVASAPVRFYPFGSLAAQLLGYVGPDDITSGRSGKYGIEEYFDDSLSGRKGKVEGTKVVDPEAGKDVMLTIDPSIETEAERILNDYVKKYNAKSGSVIVADPTTGKILALGNTPAFDPNEYSTYPLETFLNPVTQKLYEPGSVVKLLTMSAGLDSGKITPDTTYNDAGKLTLNGRTIKNHDYDTNGPHGITTMTGIIEQSLNVGAVFIEQHTGRDIFKRYLQKFGLEEKTGITLPGELKGDLRQLTPKARDIAFATASYGQGIAMTPLELLAAVSSIANGGTLMKPSIDASRAPKAVRRVISEDTARAVTRMMVDSVDFNRIARVNGYSIAGKTGTAYVPSFEHKGYTDQVINTYIGFGPAKNPRFIILFKLDEPQGAPLAGLSIVPAFRELAQFILNYYAIPPDRLAPQGAQR